MLSEPGDLHAECAELRAKGWTEQQIMAKVEGRPTTAQARSLTRTDIILGVFFANLLTAGVVAVIAFLFRALSDAAH